MQEWKIKQEIYHRLNTEHSDDLKNVDAIITDNIIDNAVRYFQNPHMGWVWPAKSYVVGICYAKWLSEIYGGDPIEYLNDPMLLYGNDPYFVTYTGNEYTYNEILSKINGWNFNSSAGIIPDIRHYFELEFGLKEQ